MSECVCARACVRACERVLASVRAYVRECVRVSSFRCVSTHANAFVYSWY